MEAAINRYRILATVVGVMLILVCFVGLPIRLITGNETPSAIISPTHGLLYMIYLIVSFDLYQKAQWPMKKMLIMVSAGLIPFLAFFVERKIVADARRTAALQQA